MGKIIEIFNRIAYNVLSALYQPFWAAVLLAFLSMFYTYMARSMDGRRIILSEICLKHGGVHLKVLQIFAGHSYWLFIQQ